MSNQVIICSSCESEECQEHTKKLIGRGTYAGVNAIKRILAGKSLHINTYSCKKLLCGECKGVGETKDGK